MTISYIIIDDEPVARKGIENYCHSFNFLKHEGSFSQTEKVPQSLLKEIGLIFLDVKLHKKNGLDFYRTLQPNPPFGIVISAYPEYAIDGFELNVADYLLKPVAFDRFAIAVNRVKELMELKENHQAWYNSTSKYFFIKTNNQIQKLNYEDIIYFEGLSNYVVIHTENRKYLSYVTLNIIMENVPREKFMRIHKSYVISIDKVFSIKGNEVSLGSCSLPVSKSYKENFFGMIEGRMLRK